MIKENKNITDNVAKDYNIDFLFKIWWKHTTQQAYFCEAIEWTLDPKPGSEREFQTNNIKDAICLLNINNMCKENKSTENISFMILYFMHYRGF